MKFLIVVACIVAAAHAQERQERQDRRFQAPPQQYPEDDQQQFQQSSIKSRGESTDRFTTQIPIIRFDKEQSADGSYKSSYETGNNIVAEETGFLKNVGDKDTEALVQHGSYSYTAPDGSLITVTYTADELGFRAEGAHIPTPPPVPEEIQKGLDLIYAGIRLQEEQAAREPKLQKLENEGNFDNYPEQPQPTRFRQ
ncbi:endocuticle structural glycoprotein SgAbd-8 [Anabrus simplex]|uniref:endocuticle structural glycoprotein SgAbd-8 n=1 Tax=Anabrus simplex TaxID=316456 RepID=UPI0034DD40AF